MKRKKTKTSAVKTFSKDELFRHLGESQEAQRLAIHLTKLAFRLRNNPRYLSVSRDHLTLLLAIAYDLGSLGARPND